MGLLCFEIVTLVNVSWNYTMTCQSKDELSPWVMKLNLDVKVFHARDTEASWEKFCLMERCFVIMNPYHKLATPGRSVYEQGILLVGCDETWPLDESNIPDVARCILFAQKVYWGEILTMYEYWILGRYCVAWLIHGTEGDSVWMYSYQETLRCGSTWRHLKFVSTTLTA